MNEKRPLRRRTRLAVLGFVLFFAPAVLASSDDPDGDGFTVDRIATLLSSNGVAFNADGSRAYVSSSYGGVSVIDTANSLNVATFDLSRDVTTPSAVGCARGKLFVVSFRDVAVVDELTGLVLRSIPRPFVAGSLESDVATTPDGDRVVVVMGTSSDLTVLDAASDAVLGTVTLGPNHNRVALSPDGAIAYATNKETGTLATVDLRSLEVARVQSISPSGPILDFPCAVAVRSATGEVVVSYVTPDYEGHLAVFGPDGAPRRVLHAGRFTTGVDVTADGRHALTGAGDVFDLDSGARIASLDVPPNGISDVAFSAEAGVAIVTNSGERHLRSIGLFEPALEVAGTPRMGERLTFTLDVPGESNRPFQLVASGSTARGIPLGEAKRFPLDPDVLFRASRAASGPFTGFVGTLDRYGRATATLELSSAVPIRGAGFPVTFALATFGASRDRSDCRKVSNAVTVWIRP